MKLSFSKKLLVMIALPLILIATIVALLSTNILRNNLNAEIQKELQIAADTLKNTYDNLYEGDYTSDSQGGKLYKGDVAISRDYSLVNGIKEGVNIDCSFYYENRIVLTTLLLPTGGRATGVKMDDELYEQVKTGEELFLPEFKMLDNVYYGYFTPLVNSDGSVVGSIFTGRPAAEVSEQINSELKKIITPSIMIMVIFLLIIILFARRLSGRMTLTKKFLEKVANGNLVRDSKLKVKSSDEIADIHKMSVTLQSELYKIVSNIKNSTDSLIESSNGLINISNGANQDVSALNESVENINRDAAEQAEKAADSVLNIHSINEQIENISKEMEDMYDTVNSVSVAEKEAAMIMEELNDANQEMLYTIGRIAEQIMITNDSVQQIQKTIDMIRNIADETDLLAMNASIEAAHAGIAGRGFAVIAEQISKLASMSADNAGEVEKTLSGIREETEKMVQLMEETKSQMDNQASKMNQTVEKFAYVARGVESSLTNVESVNSSMDALDAAKETVLDRVQRLADISNQFVNATDTMQANTNRMNDRMKEMEATANRLEEISESLSSGLDNFKL